MKLEDRTFSQYYPKLFNKQYCLPKTHGVKISNFRLMPNFFYDFGIYSPSAQGGQRRYELSFAKQAPKGESLPENYFRGLLGESIMRIVFMEFLRNKKQALGIKEFSMIKNNPSISLIKESKNYYLEYQSRYNANLYEINNVFGPVGEYDGLTEYTKINGKKGLVVMESKTGVEGVFANPEKNKYKLLERYAYSLKELYPEHEIDLLFMGNKDRLISPKSKNLVLNSRFSSLTNILEKEDVGTILFSFPINKQELNKMGTRMSNYHSLRQEEIPSMDSNNRFVENGKYIWFLKGKRISKIIEKNENNSWIEIFPI